MGILPALHFRLQIGSHSPPPFHSSIAHCPFSFPTRIDQLHVRVTYNEVVRSKASFVYAGFSRTRMATRAELDRRAHEGEVVVPGGAGGHSLEAQEHLAQGRHKGGETRAHQLGHEGFVEMGKKGGLASHGADPYQAAIKQGVHIDEHKFMNETSIEELDRRAREGEVIVPGGTGGHSLEAQKHLAEGRHKGGVTRAHQLGHEGYVEIGKKGGLA